LLTTGQLTGEGSRVQGDVDNYSGLTLMRQTYLKERNIQNFSQCNAIIKESIQKLFNQDSPFFLGQRDTV